MPTPVPTPAPIPIFVDEDSSPLLSELLGAVGPGAEDDVEEAPELELLDVGTKLLLELDDAYSARVTLKPLGFSTAGFGLVKVCVNGVLKQSQPVTM